MGGLRNWKFTTDTGNSIGVVATSKTQARKQFKHMFMNLGRVVSIEDDGPAQQPLPNPWKQEAAKKPVKAIKKQQKQRPNERCACGSGKKFKRCCGSKVRRARSVRPVQPSPPEQAEQDLHGLREDPVPEVPGEGQER